jgi:tetratricopeptide (TPR) repeat protein
MVVALTGVHLYLTNFPGDYDTVFIVALIFFIPGRISSAFLKDLYRCRRHFDQQHYEEAIDRGWRFLRTLKAEPWRRKLIYLTWSLYTWNVEAMARNNIGASLMMLGSFEAARRELQAALAVDAGYALPYANLAAMAAAEGDREESARLVAMARHNGYAGRPVEKLLDRVGAAYAKMQGVPLTP